MEDPEQKTAFYNQTARKLLEFGEALERDNYIQAVSRNTLSIMKICGGWSTSSEAGMASGRRQQADMRVAMVIHIEPEIQLVRYKTGR